MSEATVNNYPPNIFNFKGSSPVRASVLLPRSPSKHSPSKRSPSKRGSWSVSPTRRCIRRLELQEDEEVSSPDANLHQVIVLAG